MRGRVHDSLPASSSRGRVDVVYRLLF
jgi:hypothetical protein